MNWNICHLDNQTIKVSNPLLLKHLEFSFKIHSLFEENCQHRIHVRFEGALICYSDS